MKLDPLNLVSDLFITKEEMNPEEMETNEEPLAPMDNPDLAPVDDAEEQEFENPDSIGEDSSLDGTDPLEDGNLEDDTIVDDPDQDGKKGEKEKEQLTFDNPLKNINLRVELIKKLMKLSETINSVLQQFSDNTSLASDKPVIVEELMVLKGNIDSTILSINRLRDVSMPSIQVKYTIYFKKYASIIESLVSDKQMDT